MTANTAGVTVLARALAPALAPALAFSLLAGCGSSQDHRPPPSEAATEPTTEASTEANIEPTTQPNAAGKQPRGAPPSEELVRLQLLVDTTAVALGGEFTLGARFDIAPGWHIYWINPGESGLSTEVAFTAPRGFTVGAPRFPGPSRFDSPGEITSYGYHDLVMVSSVVKAPARANLSADLAEVGEVQLLASASWLACRDVCIRGQAEAGLSLPLASSQVPARAAHAELFQPHQEALPTPFSSLDGAAASLDRDAQGVTLVVEVKGADRLEYFPSTDEDLAITGQVSSADAGRARLLVSYKPDKGPIQPAGVVAVHRTQGTHYYVIALEEK